MVGRFLAVPGALASFLPVASVRGADRVHRQVHATLVIEDYVRALIGLSKLQRFAIGVGHRRRRAAPYQVAVVIRFEDVKRRYQCFQATA